MDVVKLAQSIGFDLAAVIDAQSVVTDAQLAKSCSSQTCHRYGTCWTCPPAAGSFDKLQADIYSRAQGVIVQTVRDDVDYYEDWELLDEIRTLHNDHLDQLTAAMRAELDNVVEFTTGGCGLCDPCTYPDTPCRKPDLQRLAISAHGIAVGATCQNAGMDYSFQNGRIRFVGMVLYGNA